jgi:hypothetical protein
LLRNLVRKTIKVLGIPSEIAVAILDRKNM